MGEVNYRTGHQEPTLADPPISPVESARQRRLAALKAAVGLWKDRSDIPRDGVQAQEQLRAEWG